jgi:PIN domain
MFMSSLTPVHFVFVDFENVPEVDLSTIAGAPVHVTLLIGKNQKKIDLELVEQIQAFAAQVKLVKVGASGHNALDLTLACYLGRAIERAPAASFAIISKDKDFAPMIAHLLDHEVVVARYDHFAALPFLHHRKPAAPTKSAPVAKPFPVAKKPSEDRSAKVIARLKNPASRNRPSDEPALRAHLKSALGRESSESKIDDIVRRLCDTGVLNIQTNGDVSYPSTP